MYKIQSKIIIFTVVAFCILSLSSISYPPSTMAVNKREVSPDKDYIILKLNEKPNSFEMDIESKEGGAVDWIGYISRLDKNEFQSSSDFAHKILNKRSTLKNEGNYIGIVYAEARSLFRYFDILSEAISLAVDSIFGSPLAHRAEVPTDEEAVYLIRSYSGSLGRNVDPEEKKFVSEKVYEGSKKDREAFTLNMSTIILDSIGILIPFTDFNTDEIHQILSAGILESMNYSHQLFADVPDIKDLFKAVVEISKPMLQKSLEIQIKKAAGEKGVSSFFKFITKNSAQAVSVLNVTEKISKFGKVGNRIYDMQFKATPLETYYFIVGNSIDNLDQQLTLKKRRIAYVGNDDNIWLIDENGENKEQVTTDGSSYFPIKSPDGSRIIFIKQRTQPDFFQKKEEVDIFIVDAETKETKKIARGGILPIWFLDSKHIFYLDKMQDDPIAADWAHPTGRVVVKNIETGDVYYPLDGVFSELGAPGLLSNRSIVYLDNYVLMLVDANGKKEELLKGVFSFAVSPDESKVAIIYADMENISGNYEDSKFGYLDLNNKDLQSGPTISSMSSLIPEDVCKETPHFGLTPPGLFWSTADKVHIIMHTGVCKEFEGPGGGNLRFSLFLMDEDLKPAYGFDVTDIIRNLNFSPDGNKLVYDTNHSIVKEGYQEIIQSAEIYIMDLQTKERRKITDGKYPSW